MLASCTRVALTLLVTLVVTCAVARAETTDTAIGQGIGTTVADVFGDGSNIPVHTGITSVVYADPVRILRHGLTYWEVLGTVHGTGWGGIWTDLSQGGPQPPEDALAHYQYAVPFVLRWPAAWDGTLVYFAHGFVELGLVAFADSFLGAGNETRYAETVAPWLSDAVLGPPSSHAYFAPSLIGLGRDGSFAITAASGEPHAGDPLSAAIDVPISRDLAELAKRLLLRLAGQPVRRTIGSGHSGGALIMQFIDSGATTSPLSGLRVFTGGNFVRAYDPASGLIFDGMIPLAGGALRPHPQYPLTAPIMLVSGGADYSAIDSTLYAGRLALAGVDLGAMVRVYQVQNLPHNFAEIVGETPNLNAFLESLVGDTFRADGDRLRPVLAALVDAMNDWLARGTPPPRSRINGQLVDLDGDGQPDAVSFPQAAGAATTLFPLGFGPALDTFAGDRFDTTGDPLILSRYQLVLGRLDHGPALLLPSVACRLGGYTLGGPFGDARLTPFADMAAHWRNDGIYRACVELTVTDLHREGLYDVRFREDVLGADAPLPSRPAP